MADVHPLALEAAGLVKTYRSRARGSVTALAAFDLSLAAGEIVGLIGPNGSGKSTAIQIMTGLIGADEGTVRVFGQAPTARPARARLGYLPEESALFPFLTAEETLDVAARLHGLDRTARRARIGELLDRLGLADVRRRRVDTFSKGMARRLAFGRAIVHEPSLLVLDEPTSGLDPDGAEVVFEMVEALRRVGTAVVFSTHMLREAEVRAKRFVILMNGRVASAGTLEHLLAEAGVDSLPALFAALLAEARS